MSETKPKVPRSEWTADELKFDRLVKGMESIRQLTRIKARLDWAHFEKRFTKQELDAMWERIK